jgi:hypothetical protein
MKVPVYPAEWALDAVVVEVQGAKAAQEQPDLMGIAYALIAGIK